MALRVEDVKKSLSIVVKNSNSDEIQSVVHLNDTQIGTSSNPKDLTITGGLFLNDLEVNAISSNSVSTTSLSASQNVAISGSLSTQQMTGSLQRTNSGASYLASTGNLLTISSGSINGQIVISAAQISVHLGSDFTTTTTAETASTLAFSVLSGEIWHLEFMGELGAANVAGLKFAIGAPIGSTIDGYADVLQNSVATGERVYSSVTAVNTLSAALYTIATASGGRPGRIWATVTAGADGTVSIDIATVSNGTVSRITAGSYLCARKSRAV